MCGRLRGSGGQRQNELVNGFSEVQEGGCMNVAGVCLYRRGVGPAGNTVTRGDPRHVVGTASAVVYQPTSRTERLPSQRHRPRLVVHQKSRVRLDCSLLFKPIRRFFAINISNVVRCPFAATITSIFI